MYCPRCHRPTAEREIHEYITCEDCWVEGQPLRSKQISIRASQPRSNKFGENANIQLLKFADTKPL